MSEDVSANQAVRIYRLRVASLRTSPHVWRRMLVRSSCSFGWSADHPCRFLIHGRSFSDNNAAASPLLSEFAFTANERFLYDVRFRDAQVLMPVWQHQVGLETILTAGPSDSFTRCIEGRGSPTLEQFLVCCLDAKNVSIGVNIVSIGSLTLSIVHVREVFKPAILLNACAIIAVHNHPSGAPRSA